MPSPPARRRKYGTDINRYLGVERPEDQISLPEVQSVARVSHRFRLVWRRAGLITSEQARPGIKRDNSVRWSFRNSMVPHDVPSNRPHHRY